MNIEQRLNKAVNTTTSASKFDKLFGPYFQLRDGPTDQDRVTYRVVCTWLKIIKVTDTVLSLLMIVKIVNIQK